MEDEFYCESCMKENLKTYVIDQLGSVFCSRKCAYDSKNYRDTGQVIIVDEVIEGEEE